jgi:hypothetical protein
MRGFETKQRATEFGQLVGAYIHEFSRDFDLSQLDGVTIAYDYVQALLDLDRGYETSHRLTPSDTHVIGIAMTPCVMRGSNLKSHIVLDANFLVLLESTDHDDFGLALHMLAHECAHVEVTHRFNTAFPGMLLQQSHTNARAAYRSQITFACWDEYAASWRSALYGREPTEGYEDTLILSLDETRQRANNLITAYRTHGKVDQILREVYITYGELMKFTAYHLGNLTGRGLKSTDLPRTVEALAGHWFAPYFKRLDATYKELADNYGRWTDQTAFEAIGTLADDLVSEGGLHITDHPDGSMYVGIPFSPETTPVE